MASAAMCSTPTTTPRVLRTTVVVATAAVATATGMATAAVATGMATATDWLRPS